MTKNVQIKDIQTKDLLYYDPNFKEQCYEFCLQRDIDCLPSLGDPNEYYQRDDVLKVFREETLTRDRLVVEHENIFHPTMLDKFRKQPIQFVFSNDELTGVIHFSDYNRSKVNLFLFDVLSDYEKSLRRLLVENDCDNSHMIDYFEQKIATTKVSREKIWYNKKSKRYRDNIVENEKLHQFQSFYLDELIGLAEYKQVIQVNKKVVDLRNSVMHAHDLVYMEDPKTDDYIYNFDSFEKFFNSVIVLLHDFRRVKNRIAFMNEEC